MAAETRRLAEFAATLRYEDIPAAVLDRACDAIADVVAVIAFGAQLPWSRILIAHARRYGAGGRSFILGDGNAPVTAPFAAFANGGLAHAFELDGATRPSAGVHPGAMAFTSALALAQERGGTGRDLITAFIAASEVMIRIGRATKHSNETRGYHAPGTTGPFGAAVSCSRILGSSSGTIANALGLAGSMSAGLVEFSKAGNGAMVKRLHFARAAESGLVAASLAADGFTGPDTVLEGECGFLRVFCDEYDLNELTRDLGSVWLTRRISTKRFACHTAGHTPIQGIIDLRERFGIREPEVARIDVTVGAKEMRRHDIRAPADVLMGQYSVPFCVALALTADAHDPRTFADADVHSPLLRSVVERTTLHLWPTPAPSPIASRVRVTMRDGTLHETEVADFRGTPDNPLSRDELRARVLLLTRGHPEETVQRLLDRIWRIEAEPTLEWLRL